MKTKLFMRLCLEHDAHSGSPGFRPSAPASYQDKTPYHACVVPRMGTARPMNDVDEPCGDRVEVEAEVQQK